MAYLVRFFLVFCFITFTLNSQTKIPAFFSDNMVLQQKENVVIWGKDQPNTKIFITTSWHSFAKTVTNSQGVWKTTIKTKKASFTPENIKIQGSSTITLKNILIGEVWFCSGQSNMEMPLKGLRKSKVLNSGKYLQIANNKNIRLFNVPRTASVLPSDDVNAEWQESDEESARNYSAIGYIFGFELYQKLNVPIGIIESSWGGTRIESWIPKQDLLKYKNIKFFDYLPKEENKQKKPSFLFNGMIHPFQNFTLKGFLWYQGESNRSQPKTYKSYMKDLIGSWRNQWENDKLPFYFVQIAPYNYKKHKKGTSIRPNLIREAQFQISQEIKNTGLAVTTDVGDCNDIHPAKKEVIAKRLSYWALANEYKVKNLKYKSAVFKSMKVNGNKVVLNFKFSKKDYFLNAQNSKGFTIAGADKSFYNAQVIVNKNKKSITLYHPKVIKPAAVRYGFEPCFKSNLITKSGLPISIFRTDKWSN